MMPAQLTTYPIILFILAVMHLYPCAAADAINDRPAEVVTEHSYTIGSGDSQKTYESLCLFGARLKAVKSAAKVLSRRGLLENFGKRQKEVFCLAADEMAISVLEEKRLVGEKTYYVKIKARVQSKDFIRAENINRDLDEQEKRFSWQEEMEQYVAQSVDPGKELSRAYRYLRKKAWRVAIIYLNHLERKYPDWSEIYYAKAIGYYAENKMDAMIDALKSSCDLGNMEACMEIDRFPRQSKGITAFKE